MTITIRPAVPSDVPTILTFVRELAEYEREPHAVTATETLVHSALFTSGAHVYVLIAELDGVAAGFALYFFNFSTWLGRPGIYLEDLYVRPDARGTGIGRRLIAHLAKIAVARGCARIDWSVLSWKTPAIAFYEKLGAVLQEEWKVCRLTGEAMTTLAAQRST
jgi:GNAT superfamily N-acetyltransferase